MPEFHRLSTRPTSDLTLDDVEVGDTIYYMPVTKGVPVMKAVVMEKSPPPYVNSIRIAKPRGPEMIVLPRHCRREAR